MNENLFEKEFFNNRPFKNKLFFLKTPGLSLDFLVWFYKML